MYWDNRQGRTVHGGYRFNDRPTSHAGKCMDIRDEQAGNIKKKQSWVHEAWAKYSESGGQTLTTSSPKESAAVPSCSNNTDVGKLESESVSTATLVNYENSAQGTIIEDDIDIFAGDCHGNISVNTFCDQGNRKQDEIDCNGKTAGEPCVGKATDDPNDDRRGNDAYIHEKENSCQVKEIYGCHGDRRDENGSRHVIFSNTKCQGKQLIVDEKREVPHSPSQIQDTICRRSQKSTPAGGKSFKRKIEEKHKKDGKTDECDGYASLSRSCHALSAVSKKSPTRPSRGSEKSPTLTKREGHSGRMGLRKPDPYPTKTGNAPVVAARSAEEGDKMTRHRTEDGELELAMRDISDDVMKLILRYTEVGPISKPAFEPASWQAKQIATNRGQLHHFMGDGMKSEKRYGGTIFEAERTKYELRMKMDSLLGDLASRQSQVDYYKERATDLEREKETLLSLMGDFADDQLDRNALKKKAVMECARRMMVEQKLQAIQHRYKGDITDIQRKHERLSQEKDSTIKRLNSAITATLRALSK